MNRHLLLWSLLVLLFVPKSNLLASEVLNVNEEKSRFEMVNTTARLQLAVTNRSGGTLKSHITLSFITTSDVVVKSVVSDEVLKPGNNELHFQVPLFLSGLKESDRDELPWFRLRYRLDLPSHEETHGIVSLSRIMPETFQLQLGLLQHPRPGEPWVVHVFAQTPTNQKPVEGVHLDAVLTTSPVDDSMDRIVTLSGRTDAQGLSTFRFPIPKDVVGSDISVTVKGKRGNEIRTVEDQTDIELRQEIRVTTDKPIYQPGQSLKIRILAFDEVGKALQGEHLQLEIKDDDYLTAYKSVLTASRFGEAHTEWTIPENARLGRYSIQVTTANDPSYHSAEIEVRRYDLPNFTVSVKPDRPYYLRDQDAVVEIQTDYLFGQHVAHAKIRVVDDSQTDTASTPSLVASLVEGEADSQGRFTATIDFRKQRQKLQDVDLPYDDAMFTAYATDPTTGRTEKRKFWLRVNREAIHIYLGTPHTLTAGLPVGIFIATQYPDGRPAECDVEVIPVSSDGDPLPLAARTVHTNRYGIALLQEDSWAPKENDEFEPLELLLKAKDGVGNTGMSSGRVRFEDDATWVSTGKIRYSSGEPIPIHIQSSHRSGPVVVDVFKGRSLLASNIVQLADGTGDVTVQSNDNFWGDVQISAHYADESADDSDGDSRIVEFPNDRGLQLSLQPTRDVYAPGDEAALSFRVRSRQKNPVESLLGISIVDRAVEERHRADFSEYPSTLDSGVDYASATRSELAKADFAGPIPEDLHLAAEYLLNPGGRSFASREFSQSSDGSPRHIFEAQIKIKVLPLKTALDTRFQKDRTYPTDESSLRMLLAEAGLNSDDFCDPWDNRFQFGFETRNTTSTVLGISAGPDKVIGTEDDFAAFGWSWPYFQLRGEILKLAVNRYEESTRAFVRDVPTLRNALQKAGEDLDQWKDPWGRAYRYEFGVSGTSYSITVATAGSDGLFSSKEKYSPDDGRVLTASFDYAIAIRRDLQDVVSRFYRETGSYPETAPQVEQAIREANISNSEMTDPWGHRYYVVMRDLFEYRDNFIRNFVGDNLTYAEYLELQGGASGIIPVTAEVRMITFRSAGPDGIEGNSDDFSLFRLSRTVAQQAASDPSSKPLANSPLLARGNGAIEGFVTDRTGALIPGVTIRFLQADVEILRTYTDDSGTYVTAPLKRGSYDVHFEFAGFRRFLIRDVAVQDRSMQLNVVLTVMASDSTSSLVAVSAASVGEVITRSSIFDFEISPGLVAGLKSKKGSTPAETKPASTMPSPSSTPRLRQSFPETLVWQPSLETDHKGHAELRFKLADNITLWSVSAIASTPNGRVGAATANITSWRPFFVEHDPPKSLTVGDEIALPIVMRSYLDRDQTFNVSIKPETWFALTGAAQRNSKVKAGEVTREIFGFRAIAPIKDGKQRITAVGTELNDAIEKPVSVHPDGREVIQYQTRLLQGSTVFEMNLPASTLSNTVHAELKLYPDLMSQLTDAMENILHRPYGCAEQQISSAYPGLLLLQHQREFGGVSSPVLEKSKRNLVEAYARLLGFQSEGGGFSYWGSGPSDVAVTAYAVEFLQGAKQYTAVDESVLKNAAVWLVDRQREDGSWSRDDASAASRDRADVLTLTGYVLRVLSNPEIGKLLTKPPNSGQRLERDTVGQAIRFMRDNSEQWGEPGSLASVALAAINIGDRETAGRMIARLEQLSHREGDAVYWDLQTNTVFLGWGLPGRVESTALSVRALAAGNAMGIRSEKTQALIDQGLQFLLRNKDRYGVWYSTQTTIRVLDTIERFIGKPSGDTQTKGRVNIWVNGSQLDSFFVLSSSKTGASLTVDISRYAKAGSNRIELRGPGSTVAMVQLVESHYVPWADNPSALEPALHLSVSFDKMEGKTGDEITSTVSVERVGFRGYGMMLAEIGLPPGVDVDRASLDRAVAAVGSALFRYDVLPDRIIAYVWPKAGGSQFQFKFRTRYGMNAQTPASSLYDYYNPEAQTGLLPVRFRID